MIGSNLIQSVVRRFTNLLDSAAAANGAGMVGFLYATAYAGNTVGAWLKGLATSAGAGFIGIALSATGAVLRTLGDKHAEIVSIKDFGATTAAGDNSAAILAAIAYAGTIVQNASAGEGAIVTAEVYVPGGVYAFASTLVLPEGVRLRGAHRAVSVLKYTGAGTAIQMGDATVVNGGIFKANICVEDLSVYASTANAASIGIKSVNCIRQCGIIDCNVWAFGTNVSLSNSANWTFYVEGGELHDAITNNLTTEDCNTILVRKVRIETAGGDNVVLNGATNANQPLDMVFDQVTVQGAQGHGVKCVDCYQVVFQNCDMEGNNLAAASANSDVWVGQGAQARTCQFVRFIGGFYSAGTSPNATHRIADVSNTLYFSAEGVLSSGGSNNYDAGFKLAATVQYADIGACSLNGCVLDVSVTASTQIQRFDQNGNLILGDGRAAAAKFDVQAAKANANLASFYNTSTTAGSVGVFVKAPAHVGATFPVYVTNDVGNIAKLNDAGAFSALKVCPGTDAGAVQTTNGMFFTTGGAPGAGAGVNGDFCFNPTGIAGQRLYFKTAGAWTGIV